MGTMWNMTVGRSTSWGSSWVIKYKSAVSMGGGPSVGSPMDAAALRICDELVLFDENGSSKDCQISCISARFVVKTGEDDELILLLLLCEDVKGDEEDVGDDDDELK